MKCFLKILFAFVFLYSADLKSQNLSGTSLGKGFSIMPSVEYVSSATIQLYPYSKDLFERGLTEDLNGGYGYGITVRKKLFRQDLSFGITTEFLKIYDDELTETFENDTFRVKARVSEELWIVPIEFSGYFNIPQFTDDLNIYLGGGLGIYFGDRKRTVLNVESKTISKNSGFSLIVLSGMELLFNKQFSGVFEIRFRQGDYSVRSEFPSSTININGITYPLEKNLNSNIFVDGLKLTLGIAYNF
jgi:hypothetical protein